MEVLFLGTSAGKPTNHRNVTSIALILQNSDYILFDCGEATQHQLMKSHLKITKLKAIHITHLHGDHIFGLHGLLSTLNTLRDDTIMIHGPTGLKSFLDFTLKQMNSLTVVVKEYTHQSKIKHSSSNYDYVVESAIVKHGIICFAYKITQMRSTKKVNIDYLYPHLDIYRKELEDTGFSPAEQIIPLIKKGISLTMEDGFVFQAENYLLNSNEVSIVIALDNYDSTTMCSLFKQCDVLIHECTYALTKTMTKQEKKEITQKAYNHKHSTNIMAYNVASKLKSKYLILTHFSPHYHFSDEDSIIEGCLVDGSINDSHISESTINPVNAINPMKIECARDFTHICIQNK